MRARLLAILALAGCAGLRPGEVASDRDGSHRSRATLAPVEYSWPLPSEPNPGPEPFDPPAIYERWFARVLACAGLDGGIAAGERKEYATIHWYLVDTLASVGAERPGLGRYVPPDTILIPWREHGVEWVVEHELLHYLTGLEAHTPGPDDPFRRCGVTDETLWQGVIRAREARAGRVVPDLLKGSGKGSPASPAGP